MPNEPDLQPGDMSEWVSYLQRTLADWDRQDPIPASGEFDERTSAKLLQYKASRGLPNDAHVDQATWRSFDELLGIVPEDQYSTEATQMGASVELKPDGKVVWTAWAPRRIKKESQGLSLETTFGAGGTHGYGGLIWWPDRDLEANDSCTLEIDFAFGTKAYDGTQGNVLAVNHFHCGTWKIGFDVHGGECQPNGHDSYVAG